MLWCIFDDAVNVNLQRSRRWQKNLRRVWHRTPASAQQGLVAGIVGFAPVNGLQLCKRPFRHHVIQPQWDKLSISIQRITNALGMAFQLRPIRTDGMRRHEENQKFRIFQTFFQLAENGIARQNLRFIKPNPQPVTLQALRQGAHHGKVMFAVTEKNIKWFNRHNSLRPA